MSIDTLNIRAVRADKDHRLVIAWRGDAESIVDIWHTLAEYAIFASLRSNDDQFRKVQVGEWGWSVHWSANKAV